MQEKARSFIPLDFPILAIPLAWTKLDGTTCDVDIGGWALWSSLHLLPRSESLINLMKESGRMLRVVVADACRARWALACMPKDNENAWTE